jgi:hypothetical protein
VGVGTIFNGMIPIAGDLNGNGKPELVTNLAGSVYAVEWLGTGWQMPTGVPPILVAYNVVASHFALADFGTPMAGGGFDDKTLDGIAEIVSTEAEAGGRVTIVTLTGQVVMSVDTVKDMGSAALNEGGGPPVIGDFDNDGFPEVGVGRRLALPGVRSRLPRRRRGLPGAVRPLVEAVAGRLVPTDRRVGVRLRRRRQGRGGVRRRVFPARSTAAPTARCCSATPRTSGTWYENPVVADVDRDDHAEIVVNSAYHNACPTAGMAGVPYVDPIHPGVRCLKNEDCVLGTMCTGGFCRCTADNSATRG